MIYKIRICPLLTGKWWWYIYPESTVPTLDGPWEGKIIEDGKQRTEAAARKEAERAYWNLVDPPKPTKPDMRVGYTYVPERDEQG